MIEFLPSRAVAVSVLGWDIHWYGLLYVAGFLLGLRLVKKLQHYRDIDWPPERWSELMMATVLGVVIGGRLGYVLLYEPAYFMKNPREIFAVWEGGMSSHGGFIGVFVALFWALRNSAVSRLAFADTIVVPVAVGLALGRLGNYINQELYGTVTTLPWGMAIPGEEGLRHPVPLYALAKNLLLAGVCFSHLRWRGAIPGRTMALFLMGYGLLRFLLEYVREPTHASVELGALVLTRGQLFTLPLFLVGAVLFWWAGRKLRVAHANTA